MHAFFENVKPHIKKFLREYIHKKNKHFKKINPLVSEVFTRLISYVENGKMVRGALVYLTYKLYSKKPDAQCLKVAAAIEMIHTALLIHDDIMDGDSLRRGQKTMHISFYEFARQFNYINPTKVGESIALCVGDIAIFLSFDILNTLSSVKYKTKYNILHFFTQELIQVGYGQIQDVSMGSQKYTAASSDILNLYRYKTARYTFSMPFILGGLATNAPLSFIKKLEKLGEIFGLIFQIKDDELGMFGDERKIGKKIGSDIRENKKTLYHHFLFTKVSYSERKKISHIFGNHTITQADIDYIHKLIYAYSIPQFIEQELGGYSKQAYNIIDSLDIPLIKRKLLIQLLEYNLNRNV